MAASGFFKRNGLTIVVTALFLTFWGAQAAAGYFAYNEEQQEHHEKTVGFGAYLATPHFWEATTENWESEFLQMGLFTVLTSFLFQKGSSESKDPDASGPSSGMRLAAHSGGGGGGGQATMERPVARREEEAARESDAKQEGPPPRPARQGGPLRLLYEHSLSITLLTLFVACWIGHAFSGLGEFNADQLAHHQAPVGPFGFVRHPNFWFQSFQNWQSEFLAIASMVVLSIFLREKNSSQSKNVDDPHEKTGDS